LAVADLPTWLPRASRLPMMVVVADGACGSVHLSLVTMVIEGKRGARGS
jgi:hypothetical protein